MGSFWPPLAFPYLLDCRHTSRTPAQGHRCPPPAGRRGQVASPHLCPSCGRESNPRTSLSPFPHTLAATEPQGRRLGAAGDPAPSPLFHGREEEEEMAHLPLGPSLSSYSLKSPHTLSSPFCKRNPLLYYIPKQPTTIQKYL